MATGSLIFTIQVLGLYFKLFTSRTFRCLLSLSLFLLFSDSSLYIYLNLGRYKLPLPKLFDGKQKLWVGSGQQLKPQQLHLLGDQEAIEMLI